MPLASLGQIFGIALISVGSYALNNQASTLAGQTLPTGVIVMGAFTLLLSAIGAFSALKESVAGLAFYLVFLLLITLILFSIGVAVMVLKSRFVREGDWMRAEPASDAE